MTRANEKVNALELKICKKFLKSNSSRAVYICSLAWHLVLILMMEQRYEDNYGGSYGPHHYRHQHI